MTSARWEGDHDAYGDMATRLVNTPPQVVTDEQAYLRFHHDCFDDPRLRVAGFPIGSGITKAPAKQCKDNRVSARGMW